jgi:putative transcriptional regulator
MASRAPLNELENGYLTGQLLVATPVLNDSHFDKAVIYILSHTEEGTMGIVVNHIIQNLSSSLIFTHLNIDHSGPGKDMPIHFGGPIESQRGFVLHTRDYDVDTFELSTPIALSSNMQILKEIAAGAGPSKSLLALGYAGWEGGQLESEIAENSWLNIPATEELVFDRSNSSKWEKAVKSIGIDALHFSTYAGHA